MPELEIDSERYAQMSERVARFIDTHNAYGGYDFKRGIEERKELATAIKLYAQGVRLKDEVERLARRYVEACRIPGFKREIKPEEKSIPQQPPTHTEQRRNTYNYQQYHVTEEQKRMRARQKARDAESKRLSDEMYLEGKRLHLKEYPACSSIYCPYHLEEMPRK